MKTLRILAVLACFVFLAGAVYSQTPEPCSGDCPDSWSPALSYQVCFGSSPNACCFLYTMRTRNSCGAQEIAIVDIIPVLNQNGACTFDRMLYEAFRDVVINNRPNFAPTVDGTCASNWRVTTGACWKRFDRTETNGGTFTHYQPCSDIECCYQFYRVCRSTSGVVTIVKLDPGSVSGDDCPTECPYYSCLATMNLDGPPPHGSKRVIGLSIADEVSIGAVTPNPTTGIASIHLASVKAGEFDLLITTNSGDVVAQKREVIDRAGEHSVAIDLNNVAGGVYHYVLVQDGNVITAGKIQVVR